MKKIPIFFACDNNYAPFLAVSLKSMQYNASNLFIYDIKVLVNKNGIDEENINYIKSFENKNFFIEFVDISSCIDDFKDNLHTRDYYSKTTYYRLFIPRLYPNLDKCLYLDCDIIINTDISNLFLFDIEDYLIGGVPDEIVYKTPEFRKYTQYRLGILPEKYINAGIIIMNLKKLREFNFENKFLSLLNKIKFSVAQDQDYINTICKDKIYYLPKTWNKQPLLDDKIKDCNEVNLFHYNLNLKPWHYDNIMYENFFWIYAKMTKYFDIINEMKKNYSLDKKAKDYLDGENLKKLAIYEAEILGEISFNE